MKKVIFALSVFWGVLQVQFCQDLPHRISYIEYFIDEDPGYGNANPAASTESLSDSVTFAIQTGHLQNGVHKVYVRAKDSSGNWSQVYNRIFYKTNIPSLTKIWYFIDQKPFENGAGKLVDVSASAASARESFTIDLSDYSSGEHKVYVVAENENGDTSNIYSTDFTITKSAIDKNTLTGKSFNAITVYPNPVEDILTCKTQHVKGNIRVDIISSSGLKVSSAIVENIQRETSMFQIQTAALSPGVYLIVFRTNDNLFVRKILKR